MLIGTGESGNGLPLLLLGLSAGNLQLLKEDRPIERDLTPVGFSCKLIVIYGETEEAIAARIKGGVLVKNPQPNEDLVDAMAEHASELSLGATGERPEGYLTPDDEGAVRVGLTTKDGKIVLAFGTPLKWLALGQLDALELADKLKEHAARLGSN